VTQETIQQNIASAVVAGERAAERLLYAVSQGVAPPNRLLQDFLDQLEADGLTLPATPRLRGFCRRIQKALEAGGCR
jgi:hypothetical protein